MYRKHGEEAVRSVENGACLCLECGHRYFLIKDLRTHLTEKYGYVFRITTKEFQSLEGKKVFTFVLFSGCVFLNSTFSV